MTFRLTLAAWVMLMIGALAALLILVQDRTLKLATEEAATSTMDGVSARTTTLLRGQVANLARATRTLSISPSLTEPSELDAGSPAARGPEVGSPPGPDHLPCPSAAGGAQGARRGPPVTGPSGTPTVERS